MVILIQIELSLRIENIQTNGIDRNTVH
jgi:hypothetical protein